MRRTRDSGGKTKKFMVYFMGILMIGSLFGIIFLGFRSGGSGGAGTVKYNDFDFINRGSFWTTGINGIGIAFTYLPTDLELILVDNNAISRLQNIPQVQITSDFDDIYAEGIALGQFQMESMLQPFNIFISKGFTDSISHSYQTINCEDATAYVPVVYFKSGNVTKIYIEQDCIIAEAGTHADIIRLKDRLVYGMFGIIR